MVTSEIESGASQAQALQSVTTFTEMGFKHSVKQPRISHDQRDEYTALWKKMRMNITLKKISLMLFLAVASISAASAFAQPQYHDDGFIRVAQNDRGRGHQGRDVQQERERSRDRSDNNGRGNAERNDNRRGGMSPDERRALRQQIDEAGREIYKPRR